MKQEKVWGAIANLWKIYRVKPIEEATQFLKNKKGKILDVGCGSGRNFVKTKGRIYGVDFSSEQLKYARQYAKKIGIDVVLKKAAVYALPFKDNFFDSAIFIATLHCIDSAEKRKKSLKELYRVMKTGAEALITVWSRNNQRIKNKPKECFIPWTVDGKKYQRYTYIYDKDELKNLLIKIGFKIKKIKEDENIIAIVEK